MVLQYLVPFLEFLFSPMGVIALGIGVLIPALIGLTPLLTSARWASNLLIWLSLWLLGRVGLVVSEQNDLLLKQRKPNAKGVETISVGQKKTVEDPADRTHSWAGTAFALIDEASGVMFSPQDAAFGRRMRHHEEESTDQHLPSRADKQQYGIGLWKPGIFALGQDGQPIVDLRNIEWLRAGGERAEYPVQGRSFIKHAYLALQSGAQRLMGYMAMLLPLAPFAVLVLAVIAVGDAGAGVADQPTNETADGNETVSPAAGLLFLAAVSSSALVSRIPFRGIAGAAIVFAMPIVYLAVLTLFSPVLAILGFITMLAGALLLIIPTVGFGKLIGSEGIAGLLMRLGLYGYKKPVLMWEPDSYRLYEAEEIDDDLDEQRWYSLAGNTIGFSFKKTPDAFGDRCEETESVANAIDVHRQDKPDDSALPDWAIPLPQLKQDVYGGWVDARSVIRGDGDEKTAEPMLVNVHKQLNRWSDAATGDRTHREGKEAKDEYGGDWRPVSGKWIIIATTLTTLISIGIFAYGFVL